MSKDQQYINTAGKGGQGSIMTDRDYADGLSASAKRILITSGFLLYAAGVFGLWLIGLKLLAIILTIIVSTLLFLSWLVITKFDI